MLTYKLKNHGQGEIQYNGFTTYNSQRYREGMNVAIVNVDCGEHEIWLLENDKDALQELYRFYDDFGGHCPVILITKPMRFEP